jgi:hypothetical protein
MNQYILIAVMLATFGLAACDKPTVVNVPPPESIPGPAGEQGVQGNQGDTGVRGIPGSDGRQGNQGETGVQGDAGETGDDTTVIVMPPDSSTPNN